MKILIISRYPPFPGGRENFVFELVKELSKNNQILILTPDREDHNDADVVVRTYPTAISSLEKIIADFKPDIINSHTFYLAKDAAEISKNQKIPFGITLHGDQFAIGDTQRQKLVSEAVALSDFVINVAENGKSSIIKNVPDIDVKKLHVIHNGVNLNVFKKVLPEERALCRKRFGIEGSTKVVVSPTRIAPYKGLEFLIDAAGGHKEFIEKNNLLFLISIPDFDFSEDEEALFDSLKKKIKDNGMNDFFKFVFLAYEDVKRSYNSSDFFLLPSEKEQLPMSILEAMACCVPIIATNTGGIPELLEDGLNAHIVSFGDRSGLFEKIGLCVSGERQKDIVENAYKKIYEHYSIEKVATHYENIYRKYSI